jgi:hypothetical protein
MSIELIVDGIIDLIKKNLIAKTDLLLDASAGDTIINVKNAYRFHKDEEIVLIDWGYNNEDHQHYQIFEYAEIKRIIDTKHIELKSSLSDNWLLSDNSFVQKTIGHSPLYEDNVLYGDREVVPIEDIAITVEPSSLSNEWIYIQGGLSEDYKVRIVIYGKATSMEEGRRTLDRYSWALYSLLNSNIHIDVNDVDTPLLVNYASGSNTVVIEDTPENRENFVVVGNTDAAPYILQDNLRASCWFRVSNVSYSGGFIYLTINPTMGNNFTLSEFAVIRKKGMYIYDSRADSVNFGQVSKGSAFLRASEINWFGKRVNEHIFPQTSDGVNNFEQK